jgi:phosphoribosylglycinamide formyltransferase-1
MSRALRLGVLVSGEGTTMEYLADLIDGGRLPAQIVLVIADRPHAHAIEKARRRGLANAVLPLKGVPEALWAAQMDRELHEKRVELVVLAGFLSVIPAAWLSGWVGRVINLHPALLPKFGGPGMYGHRVHEAVIAAGERESGASVHLVTPEVDEGPVLLQARVPVLPGDTPKSLEDRIRPVERELLAQVIRRFADGAWPIPYVPPAAAGRRDGDEERARRG